MGNSLLTPTAVTRQSLRILHQKLNFVGTIVRDYDSSFAKTGAKIGDTLKIRLPNEYTVSESATLDVQDTPESSVEFKINKRAQVAMNFSSEELTLSMDDFTDRIIDPAMSVMAAKIEANALGMYKDVYNQVNNQGAPITMKKVLDARKKLVDNLAPLNKRVALLNTQDNVDLVDANKGLFQDSTKIAEQYREGMMGRTGGFDFYENTLLPSHTRGAANGSYTVDTRTSNIPVSATAVSTLTTSSGAGAINVGDVFTIANVYRVHPETKDSTGELQQFVATATMASAGSLSFAPAIVLAGGRQNVTISSASATAAITVAGTASTTHGISLFYQREAFAFGTADLVMPKGVDFSSRQVLDGISMRIVRQYDINNDKLPCRCDVLYGFKAIRPQLAARGANN